MRLREFAPDNTDQGVAEARKKKKKKSSRLQGYFFPGYGYYGSGDSGEGGGDGGGGESKNHGMAEGFSTDSELRDKQQFALRHYGNYPKEPGAAFDKWVQRSLMHSEQDAEKNAISIKQLQTKISKLEKQMNLLSDDAQGVAEGSLEEKSTSQAQFRTMAAAAHDPAFARKVGIKQSVAKEFNKADKGQSYKSLPKKN
jgi:hypothetical protein